MKYVFSLLFVFFVVYSVVWTVSPVFAADPPPTLQGRLEKVGSGVYGGTGKLEQGAFEKQVGGIINIALTLVGVIFLILTVYGGYIWMIARGDETQAKKAKDIIIMATIGMAVVLAAYVLTNFIVTRLTNATTTTASPSAK
ncbi:MAG: hypothetical protein HY981_04475 [Candidatus Magasanikbacteria bacterium]|nr:hypothetical protein [Candidatus Magasanikbacteria bacterium]